MQWVQVGYTVAARAHSDPWGRVDTRLIADHVRTCYGVTDLAPFFALSSRTPTQIGERFRWVRDQTKLQFHSLIRSAFLETPLIDFGEGRYVAPDPTLVFRHCEQGLYEAVRQLPSFGGEFGDSVERYVRATVSAMSGVVRLCGKRELESSLRGKSCDFLAETADCIFLVEAKATTFRAKLLTEAAVLKDGSTGKVADALGQLRRTAADVRASAFAELGVDGSKPICAAVATYGRLPFANSDWYFEKFVRRMGTQGGGPAAAPATLDAPPAIMSLDQLDMFVVLLNRLGVTPTSVMAEKAGHAYVSVGDWEQFLRNRLTALAEPPEPLQFVRAAAEAFWTSMGVSEDRLPRFRSRH
jgi:hypothetical protein